MNRLYPALILLIACLSSIPVRAGQKLHVFFIGNSYTHTNNLPRMIADIAASMGDTLVHDEHTPGGYKFRDHWSNFPSDPCIWQIRTRTWDYVVLQEQSQWPVFSESGFFISTYMYAEQFCKQIRDSARCTDPMFYMTWGYKDGDAVNCPTHPHMCTYESMDSILRVRYMQLADSFKAVVSPVGALRRYIREKHPGIELYQADGSHPEVAGTYAAACCFYVALFKKDPSSSTFNSSLQATEAALIRAAAKAVVFDSLAKWNLGINDHSAGFDQSISGTTVTFTNKSSLKAQTYRWDFGDGSSSALKNPLHTYAGKGVYRVTLTTYDANGCTRVVSNNVNLTATGMSAVKQAGFSILPNPATGSITVSTESSGLSFGIRISNALGQTVYLASEKASAAGPIDISAFSDGVYYITLFNETGELHHDKFVKR